MCTLGITEVSIPHRKFKNMLRQVNGALVDSFPSLIGSSKTSWLAGWLVGRHGVSIPHRKFKNSCAKGAWKM